MYKLKKPIHLSQVQFIALGFLITILSGTLLLMLPLSSRSGTVTDFFTSLFTAVSASCVTGLVLVDTATHWSAFGQFVIMILIQTGGLGFISIGVFFSMILRKKISLSLRGLMKESTNSLSIGGMVKLTKKILIITAITELSGALLLSIRFIPKFGLMKGIWYAIFHAVSAFCNAGFDLLGVEYGQYASLTGYADDVLVNLTIMALILIGGIGFIVWDDISRKGIRFKRYRLHTKIVLCMSIVLLIIPTVLFYITEKDTVLNGLNVTQSLLGASFSSVTARTAGFNTLDLAKFTDAGKLIFIIIMFIGAGSGSTAGGVKITSFFVILAHTCSSILRKRYTEAFNRTINTEIVLKAISISTINLSLILIASIIINHIDKFAVMDILYEITSAVSTVGVTTGITRDLSFISKCILIVLMYLGRVGGLSFALSLSQNKQAVHIKNPSEDISIG